MAFRIDDDENRIQDLKDQIDQLEIQTFSPEVVARNESTRNTGIETGDGAATNPYPEWYPVRDFGTLGNLTLEILLNRTDSQIAKMTLNGDVDFAFSLTPPLNKGMWFILDVTIDAVGGHIINLPGNVIPASTTIDNTANARTVLRFTTTDGGTTFFAENLETGGGGTTGTFISADLTADQITNLAVGDHVEFDRNATPTGADGGIVLQTGVGQANGIFELKIGKTYFLSAAVAPFFGAANDIDLVWFDITNTTELGRRSRFSDAVLAMNQPKCEISFTPLTDVTVELRLVAATTPANLNGYDADHTFAHIFEFSGRNGADGAPGTSGAVTWKTPARAKTLVDVPTLSSFDVITDGVTLVENDRVLLTAQTTTSENGLYVVGVVAGGFAPLTRPTDFDTDAEVLSETFVAIEEGQLHKNELYHLITNNPILIDATGQLWELFAPGTSGGPDLGGGSDGIDGDGQFVNDGRVGIGANILKKWEQINDFVYPNNFIRDLLYLPSVFANPTVNGRLLMCGGQNATNRSCVFSDNYGRTWNESGGGVNTHTYNRLAFDGVNTVVMVSDLGPATPSQINTVRRSTDRGANFSSTAITSGTTLFRDVIWSPVDSLFVMVAANTPTNAIWTSPDGNTWTQRTNAAPITVPAAGWVRITFSDALDLYLVTSATGLDVMTSPDAINWTVTDITGLIPTSLGGNGQRRLIWSQGQSKFVTVNTSGIVSISTDGINWTQNTIPGAPVLRDILWAADLSVFLVMTDQDASPSIFWFSNDAESWTNMPINTMRTNDEGTFGTAFNKGAIAYSQEWNYFFGCGGGSQSGFGTDQALFWRTAVFFNGQDNA